MLQSLPLRSLSLRSLPLKLQSLGNIMLKRILSLLPLTILAGLLCFPASLCLAQQDAPCRGEALKQARATAKTAYDHHDIAGAITRLNGALKKCTLQGMHQQSDAGLQQGLWLISDLMFYQHKAGDQLGCLTLGDEVFNTWLVSEPDRYGAKVTRALEANIRQCQHKLAQEYPAPTQCPVKGYETMWAIPERWKKQDNLLYEVACIGFVANTPQLFSDMRDGPKFQSEGMKGIARFNLLYSEQLQGEMTEAVQTKFAAGEKVLRPDYRIDPLYVQQQGQLWGGEWCYRPQQVGFGAKAGDIFINLDVFACPTGSASLTYRLLLSLHYPFNLTLQREDIFARH